MDEQLIRRLIATIKCSVCGQHYEGEDVKILGHRDDLWFLSVSCASCQTQGLVAVVIKEGKRPYVVTDLTEKDKTKFRHMEAVAADDVLDVHDFLKGFDGDFGQLFSVK